jgi:hypothetical protein
MTGKQFRLSVLGFVGCAVIALSSGCDAPPKPTIDTSGQFKTPEKPTATKVDVKPGGAKGTKLK